MKLRRFLSRTKDNLAWRSQREIEEKYRFHHEGPSAAKPHQIGLSRAKGPEGAHCHLRPLRQAQDKTPGEIFLRSLAFAQDDGLGLSLCVLGVPSAKLRTGLARK